jgi:hypothetical protein
VYGVGAGYDENIVEEQYDKIAWDQDLCNSFSFRGLLAEKLNLTNLNFAEGGSSNQRQFRIAKDFFFSDRFTEIKKKYNKIIVLWGITSTARNELYSAEQESYVNFPYNGRKGNKVQSSLSPLISQFPKYCYDHDHSIYELTRDIKMFNFIFKGLGIENLWFDVFNHHDYVDNINFPLVKEQEIYNKFKGDDWPSYDQYKNNSVDIDDKILDEIKKSSAGITNDSFSIHSTNIENFLFYENKPRDLLYLMLKNYDINVMDFKYHISNWEDDNAKISQATKQKLLNPISFHPTKLGHRELSKILEPEVLKMLKNGAI